MLDAGRLEKRIDDQVGRAGGRRPVELAGLGAGLGENLLQRAGTGRRRTDRNQRRADAGNRGEIAGIVRQLGVQIGMRRERRRRSEQQRVIVAGAGEGVDGDEAVAARTIFDHHGRPHLALSFSAISRAPRSAPEPGPSVRMNFTGRAGHSCALAGAEVPVSASVNRTTAVPRREILFIACIAVSRSGGQNFGCSRTKIVGEIAAGG